jgi:hypothetical protein
MPAGAGGSSSISRPQRRLPLNDANEVQLGWRGPHFLRAGVATRAAGMRRFGFDAETWVVSDAEATA